MRSIRTNRFVRRIMSEVSEADPYVAVKSLVGKYRCPGETLEKVAEKLRVRKITVEPMGVDGGVHEDAFGLQVKLNSSSPLKRRRFTLAHELGHLILASGGSRGARRSHASTELERACDAVAAELLMPLDEVRCIVPREASIDGLLAVADRFGASLHAAAVRINQLGIWTESVGFWKWDGSAHELWFVGRRPWREKSIFLDAFARAMTEGGTVRTSEIIREPDRDAFYVSLSLRRLGREFLIALLHTGRGSDPPTVAGRGSAGASVQSLNGTETEKAAELASQFTHATAGGPQVAFDFVPSQSGLAGAPQSDDAPSCADCGAIMVRNGSRYRCMNCGATSGCS